MSLDNALFNATSGLRHTSRQIAIASHNLSNAGTDGYSRKTVAGESLALGGVKSQEARRDVDLALRTAARGAQSNAASMELRASVLGPLAKLQGDPEDGRSLGGLVGELRDSLTALRTDPGESAMQNQALRAAEEVAYKLNMVANGIRRARQDAHDGLITDVGAANNLIKDIARLDREVRAEFAAGRAGADAQDRRDAAIGKLSAYLDVRSIPTGTPGGINLVIGSGTIIPMDERKNILSIPSAVFNSSTLPAGHHLRVNGRELPNASWGGRIGERFDLRDRTLPRMEAEVDMVASVLATRLDDQGLRLFTRGDGTAPLRATAPGSPQAILGFASEIRVHPDVAAQPELIRDGTPDATGYVAPPSPVPAGYVTLLNKVITYAFGDKPGPGPVTHPAIPGGGLGPDAAAPLNSRFAPPNRIVDYAAAVSGAHASEAADAERLLDDAKGFSTHITGLVQRREGVDMDQEMAAMVQLQNAYSANARVMATVQTMWDSLLAAVR
jgi:flagellar hook-associated protein 1 FlgK